ncbi:MAG: TVP38/TMEM64 family protein [Eubacterium sp.]|nr:TVP38/TMEM64 family protein [Eubacterium sp.]
MSDKNAEKKNKIFAAVKFAVLLMIVIGLPLYVYVFHKDFILQFRSFDEVVAFLRQYKAFSVPVYLGAELLQILISVLPGQVFQFVAGYLFGFIPGLIYTAIGAVIGTIVTFCLARVLGTDAVHLMLGKERTDHFIRLLNSRKAYLITFLIYLIPGVPKDTVCYIAGVSEMKMIPFVIISVVGRMPAMAASIVFGAMYMKQNYTGMAVVAVLVCVIVLVCIIRRKDIMKRVDMLYEKYH